MADEHLQKEGAQWSRNQRIALLRGGLLLLLVALGCQANPWRTEPEPTPVASVAPASTEEASKEDARFVEVIAAAPESFNPVLTTQPEAHALAALLLPRLLELDGASGAYAATGIAERWEWSPDAQVITFTLRSDLQWSDGTPITARDIGFTYAALASPAVDSPNADMAAPIHSILLPDDQTLVVQLQAPNCAALASLLLPVLPSHLFAADLSDFATNTWNQAPTVGAGAFLYDGRDDMGRIVLARHAAFWQGAPTIEHYVLMVEADAARRLDLVASGVADLARSVDVEAAAALAGTDATSVHLLPVAQDAMALLAINLADPLQAQAGVDESGVRVTQAEHPVLADARVRQAIAASVPWAQIVTRAYGSAAQPLHTTMPDSVAWARADDLTAWVHDVVRARALLQGAGWVDAGGDGIRERAGDLLQLTLITNAENAHRVQMAREIASALRTVGMDVRFEALPFAQMTRAVLEQTYDLAIVGWEELGSDPATSPFWHSSADVPGSGLNITSYQNAEVDRLYSEALVAPDCDIATRAAAYQAIQRQIHADIPAIPLLTPRRVQAQNATWQGPNADPWSPASTVVQWRRTEAIP